MRQLWATTILECDDFDSLETVLEQNVELFRELRSVLRLRKNITVFANLHAREDEGTQSRPR